MKNLFNKLTKNVIFPLAFAGSLVFGRCGNGEENIVTQEKDDKIEKEEKELYGYLDEKMISPNSVSGDNQYCILPCQLDSVNKNNDLVVFDLSAKKAKKITDTPEINENGLCIFNDYVAFFGEFKRGNLHLQNVYVANYKTGEITELASYNYNSIKDKYVSFVDNGQNIKLVNDPPKYFHKNTLYKDE